MHSWLFCVCYYILSIEILVSADIKMLCNGRGVLGGDCQGRGFIYLCSALRKHLLLHTDVLLNNGGFAANYIILPISVFCYFLIVSSIAYRL